MPRVRSPRRVLAITMGIAAIFDLTGTTVYRRMMDMMPPAPPRDEPSDPFQAAMATIISANREVTAQEADHLVADHLAREGAPGDSMTVAAAPATGEAAPDTGETAVGPAGAGDAAGGKHAGGRLAGRLGRAGLGVGNLAAGNLGTGNLGTGKLSTGSLTAGEIATEGLEADGMAADGMSSSEITADDTSGAA
jgi:hypothetical protein